MTSTLDLLPAVDVSGGRSARLLAVGADAATAYGEPLDAALAWQSSGARWVHLVDLDAAFGRGSNAELLAAVVDSLDVDVQLSGGIQDAASLAAALATGCRRVVLSSAALGSPRWCAEALAEYGDRLVVGLDVQGRVLAPRGGGASGDDLFEVIARLDGDGCARYVVTDVQRDGAMGGPNLGLLRSVCAVTTRPILASGGVSNLADLRALAGLAKLGVEGVVVGSALYAGAFTLGEALDALAEAAA